MNFLKKDILVSLVIKLSPEYLINRNPLRLDPSTIRLKDITKAVIIEILINKNIIESEYNSILGLKENGKYIYLILDLRIVGFLKARCQVSNPLAVIYIALGIYSSLTAAGVKDLYLGQLILSPPPLPKLKSLRPKEKLISPYPKPPTISTRRKRPRNKGEAESELVPRGRRRELSIRRKPVLPSPKLATIPSRRRYNPT